MRWRYRAVVLDLAEAVELVAQHVEQQREPRLHALDEEHRVRLVELEHGDVGCELAAERALLDDGRDDAAREVGSRAVREHAKPLGLEHLDDHLRGRRLPVRAAHRDHTERQPVEDARHESGVEALDDEAGERGSASAEPSYRPNRFAGHRREKITHGSRLVVQQVWPGARASARRAARGASRAIFAWWPLSSTSGTVSAAPLGRLRVDRVLEQPDLVRFLDEALGVADDAGG